MTIEKKALKLAEYNGWEIQSSITSAKKGNEYMLKLDLFNIYSSFDKLMELVVNINQNQSVNYWIEFDSNKVSLLDEYDNFGNYFYGQKRKYKIPDVLLEFKEALMDCLLKYFELIGE